MENTEQVYELHISSLGTDDAGGVATIAIMDGDDQIDLQEFRGKVTRRGPGYRRLLSGNLGLTARLLEGHCEFSFTAPLIRQV